MDRLMIRVYDEATDTIIDREMTDEEQAEFNAANPPMVETPAVNPPVEDLK